MLPVNQLDLTSVRLIQAKSNDYSRDNRNFYR